jgi:hypothetical protein
MTFGARSDSCWKSLSMAKLLPIAVRTSAARITLTQAELEKLDIIH